MDEDTALLELMNHFPLDLQSVYFCFKRSLITKKISYIPYLVDIKTLALSAKESGMSISRINSILSKMDCEPLETITSFYEIETLNTIDIIKYADTHFNTNKMTNNLIYIFKDELNKRTDLFEAFISYISTWDKFKSELYFWQPDLEICDVCTLILSLFNIQVLVKKYRDYMKESIILCRSYQANLLSLLKERYKLPLYSVIDIMKQDVVLYPVEANDNCISRIVSHEYWCEKCDECKESCKVLKENMGIEMISNKGDYSKVFRPCLSYVEIELNDKMTLLMPVTYLEDLFNGCKVYKGYWFEKKVIDKYGNIII